MTASWGVSEEGSVQATASQPEENKIRREFRAIPEVMDRKAVYRMKNRAAKMVRVGGKAFEGKTIRL